MKISYDKEADALNIEFKSGPVDKTVELSPLMFLDLDKKFQKLELPAWLFLDAKSKSVKIVSDPVIDEVAQIFNIRSIVEFYSR